MSRCRAKPSVQSVDYRSKRKKGKVRWSRKGRLTGWLVGWLIRWLVGCLVAWLYSLIYVIGKREMEHSGAYRFSSRWGKRLRAWLCIYTFTFVRVCVYTLIISFYKTHFYKTLFANKVFVQHSLKIATVFVEFDRI